MNGDISIANHYAHGNLLAAIKKAIAKQKLSLDNITIEQLSLVDEFHVGGRVATEHLLAQLNFAQGSKLLDVGCGLGGAARYVATQCKSYVSGIDITAEYIDTGNTLNQWVNLGGHVSLTQGSALAMPYKDNSFDGGYMLHVGMNISKKLALFKDLYRVLRKGATFGLYDIMRIETGELKYPVPWASNSELSYLETPDVYVQMLEEAGFTVSIVNNRRDFALSVFNKQKEMIKRDGGTMPLGLHRLMKETTTLKINNLVENIKASYIAPVEIIVSKNSDL